MSAALLSCDNHLSEPCNPLGLGQRCMPKRCAAVPLDGMRGGLKRNAADAARPGAQLIYFFTAGEDEVKCWQIRKGCKAPQARPMICSQ